MAPTKKIITFLHDIGIKNTDVHDWALLEQALTHKSYAADFTQEIPHNERLEFIGDAIVGSVVATLLFVDHPDKDEASMTLYKIALVREETLAKVARDIHIDAVVRVSKGEEKGDGRKKDSILSDTLEALIGYITIDQGYQKAYTFIEKYIYPYIQTIQDHTVVSYKTQLQERSQKKYKKIPIYIDHIDSQEDTGNVTQYRSQVSIHEDIIALGYGPSKKKAQEDAAMHALNILIAGQPQANK